MTAPDPPISKSSSYAISIHIYGRGDAALGDGPSHMGIAIYELGSSTCEMHHIRNPDDTNFIYDPRIQPLEDPVLRGRCELNNNLSAQDRDRAVAVLSDFGRDTSHIPEFGVGNCQDWVADAVAMLERAGLVREGEGVFWRGMINLSAGQMEAGCLATGRVWVRGSVDEFEGVPDARFSESNDMLEKRMVGKLKQNPIFQDRIQALTGGGSRSIEDGRNNGNPTERPFYISSPFFSRT